MAQQTAVEWFLANLPHRFKNALITACEQEIEKAKEMECNQIKTAYLKGKSDGYDEREGTYGKYLDENDYYDSNYTKNIQNDE